MSDIILGKDGCTCCMGPNHLFLILPDGSVLFPEFMDDDSEEPPGTRYVTVPGEIVDFIRDGGANH